MGDVTDEPDFTVVSFLYDFGVFPSGRLAHFGNQFQNGQASDKRAREN
jgi:hypothetical protein